MMKKIFILGFFLFHIIIGFAQTDTAAPYWKNRALPSFKLLNLDSTFYSNAQLKKDRSTIIMLFNPECEHCQDQFKLLVSMPEIAASVQIVLSSTETMDKIKLFYTKFGVGRYSFVRLTKDDQYVFGKFFQPKTIPVVAFYNKQQQFIAIKQGQASRQEILAWLKD